MSEALQLDLSDLPKQQVAPLTLDLSDLPKVAKQSSEGAVRNLDLKPVQISDLINNMLDDAQRAYVATSIADNSAGEGSSRDRDAVTTPASDLPEAGAIKNPAPEDTNTSKDANADTNVLDSNGKPKQMISEEEAGNKGEAASDGSLEGHRTQAPRIDIYVHPRNDQGYDFVAINSSNQKVIKGQFNTTTVNDTNKVQPGDYTISYRPHIEVKSGIDGIKQTIGAMWSGNLSGNVNKNEGYPTLSNTDDWNTIKY